MTRCFGPKEAETPRVRSVLQTGYCRKAQRFQVRAGDFSYLETKSSALVPGMLNSELNLLTYFMNWGKK